MKRLLIVLFLLPSMAYGAFTEFFCRASGSNLNGGALNSGAEPSTTAAYTSTSGNWSTVTNVFTPTDGSTPANTVTAGDFASIYVDGATTAVYIARVTLVGAGVNGTITVSATAVYGTAPTTNSGARSIKVGGAWLGPNAAATFPFGLSGTIGALKNANSDAVRVNVKNDQTYTMTAALPFTTLGTAVLQGYTTNAGDLGKATFSSNLNSAGQFTLVSGASTFVDLIFANTASTNANNLFFSSDVNDTVFLRCVFHGSRANGFVLSTSGAGNAYMIECEAYDNNKSNSANTGAFTISNSAGGVLFCYRCYSHDNTGSNSNGFLAGPASGMILVDCIADTNAGNGAKMITTSRGLIAIGNDFYNNTGDGITIANTTATAWSIIMNNNFLLNAKGVNNTATGQGGILYNNGRGAGTQANTGADVLGSIYNTSTDITYASNLTPWVAPTTGNFTQVWAQVASQGAGRGAFTETDGTNTGTVSYPDIGEGQAPTPTATATATATPTATATSTATSTATFTPTATATASFTPCGACPNTPTPTPTFTPTATATATSTPTPTPTAPIQMSGGKAS